MKIFLTGIGTDVGKTIVSAILVKALQADYFKPVQAGDLDNSDTIKVKRLSGIEPVKFHHEIFRLNTPASPHYAAKIDGVHIGLNDLPLPETNNHLIVEGAGGLMVPLNDNDLYIDWANKQQLPVILVSRHYLGSINHTLLSLETIRSRNMNLLGVIFVGDEHPSTEQAILEIGQTRMIARMNEETDITPAVIEQYARKWQTRLKNALEL